MIVDMYDGARKKVLCVNFEGSAFVERPKEIHKLNKGGASVSPLEYYKIWKFSQGFYFRETSQLRSFVKTKPSRNGKFTVWFTDVTKSYPIVANF